MGAIYVEVDANAVNGIMTLDTSSGGGQEEGYWLYWNSRGFTGINWYWGEENNYIQTGWPAYVSNMNLTQGWPEGCNGHSDDVAGLSDHIAGGHADNLNDVLGSWPPGEKMQFVGSHYDEFYSAGCLR